MQAFEYRALDAGGKETSGVLEGDTARQVRQSLRDQGLTPLSVDELADAPSRAAGGGQRQRIRAMELALVTRQLASLLQSGLPVEEALRTVAEQAGRPQLERILLTVRSRVREGHSLADGLAEFPRVFPELYHRTVAAGEETGHLNAVLERLAEYTEQRQQMRQQVVLALFYPALLTLVSLLIVTGLVTYVVPQVVRVFDHVAQDLPWITRALIAFSDALRTHGLLALVLLVLAGIGARLALRRPMLRSLWHGLLLKLPLIGRLRRNLDAARFARTLSILVGSGVPILEALRVASQVLDTLPMRAAVEAAAERVREGSSLHAALEQSACFPPITLSLLASGESGGDLEGMLARSAEIQERETTALVATLLGLFEPLVILLMGGVVLVIVLAVLLPIFELNQLVG